MTNRETVMLNMFDRFWFSMIKGYKGKYESKEIDVPWR